MMTELEPITAIVCRIGKIAAVPADDDFYDAGFSSINALELLLELESTYDISIPDDDFIQARTITALRDMIDRLKQE